MKASPGQKHDEGEPVQEVELEVGENVAKAVEQRCGRAGLRDKRIGQHVAVVLNLPAKPSEGDEGRRYR